MSDLNTEMGHPLRLFETPDPAAEREASNARLLADVRKERAEIAAARDWRQHQIGRAPETVWVEAPEAAMQARELALSALLLRAGVAEPAPVTPEALARRELEEKWSYEPPEDDLAQQLIAAEEKLSPREREANVERLIKDYGKEGYEQICADAHKSYPAGATIPEALFSCRTALFERAAVGRFQAAKQAELNPQSASNPNLDASTLADLVRRGLIPQSVAASLMPASSPSQRRIAAGIASYRRR